MNLLTILQANEAIRLQEVLSPDDALLFSRAARAEEGSLDLFISRSLTCQGDFDEINNLLFAQDWLINNVPTYAEIRNTDQQL